jgi:hypothetical protein
VKGEKSSGVREGVQAVGDRIHRQTVLAADRPALRRAVVEAAAAVRAAQARHEVGMNRCHRVDMFNLQCLRRHRRPTRRRHGVFLRHHPHR